MTAEVFGAFVIAMLVVSLSPGSGCMYTLSTASSLGFYRTWSGILGLQLGLLVQLMVVGLGLGAVIAKTPELFVALQWLGVVYLAYLGLVKLWRPLESLHAVETGLTAQTVFQRAVWINVLNPKAFVFLGAFFPQFINPETELWSQYLILAVTMVIIDVLVMLQYAWLASKIRVLLKTPRLVRLQDRVFGVLFLGASAALAWL